MIRKYRIGNPINTESVVLDINITEGLPKEFEYTEEMGTFTRKMSEKAVIYGLGETVRGINKRGFEYRSFCSDDPNHDEDKQSLYAAQNFFIVDDAGVAVGFYFDIPGAIRFDFGFHESDRIIITPEDMNFDLYVIEGNSKIDIVREFRGIIGRSYIPPKWAFGFCQSRWSYFTEDEVSEVCDRYREAGIPLDSVVLDIDYLERYKDFTINREAFPNFEKLVDKLKEQNIHLVPIIDAGIKIEEGYEVYEEGLKKGYFCKKEDGTPLVAAVWPGQSHLPDFLNSDVRKWFGDKYSFLVDKGIDGFWNDMNEPAIFYTKDHLEQAFEEIDGYKGKNLDIDSFFSFKDIIYGISNSDKDYKSFYHNMDGEKVNHYKVHNLYGYNMTRAAGEAFERMSPDKRILMYSRSSYIGMHRYGGVWTGDNKSWWSHLLLNVTQLPALNMCGFLFNGADTGGFGAHCCEELMKRWLAVSIFTPLFRNHSSKGTRRQELYAFGDTKDFKNLVELRYALIPYLYSEYMKAVFDNDMLFKPLSFEYTDDRVNEVEDELLVGESLMIAPVTKENATGRYVYLPEDMKLIRFRSYDDYDEEEVSKGDHYIRCKDNEVLVFIRPGHALPLAKPAKTVPEIDYSTITYLSYKAEGSSYKLYNDDGISRI